MGRLADLATVTLSLNQWLDDGIVVSIGEEVACPAPAYGVSGALASAWGSSSTLCVKAPTQRTGVQLSGGTSGGCDGVLSLDWNASRAANPLALGGPFVAGDSVWAQAWWRDPASAKKTCLSDGLAVTLCP